MNQVLKRLAELPPHKRAIVISRLPPLSFAQQRLWFIDQLEGGSAFYNLHAALRLRGQLNVSALERTFGEITRRHEILRTVFVAVDGQPVQLIQPDSAAMLPQIDLSQIDDVEREAERLAREEAQRPFDLATGPLLRVTLLKLTEDEHIILLTMHHIVSDGWSIGVLVKEVAALYQAFSAGQPSPLPELAIQYADYASWQREYLQGEVLENQLSYWRRQLGGELPVLELPTDRPRPAVQSYRGAHSSFTLSADVTEQLKALSRQHGMTLYMTLLAAFQLLLMRYTGQTDVAIGTPVAGRTQAETEQLIGFFINTLVMRTDLSGDPTFVELLKRVREVCLGAYAHQDVPFEKLVEELQPERSLSHTPLFQILMVLQNAPTESLKVSGLMLSSLNAGNASSQFDLHLSITESKGEMLASLQYNSDLFDASTIRRMAEHFDTLLTGIVAHPEERISRLPLLGDRERQQLIVEWNDTAAEYPREQCIHQLFEAQVERTPEAIAVVYEDQQLTYRELNSKANQLAHHLRKLGVGPEVLVGICMERSVEMVVSLLAVLKAGGAYLPLDPEYPAERVSFMLEDSGVRVLATQARLIERLPAHRAAIVCVDTAGEALSQESAENPKAATRAANLAYVIYTSGSTGKPKGVMIPHSGVCNRLVWMQNAYGLTPLDSVLQKTPFSFDVSVWEFFWTLLFGARLVMARPGGHRDGAYLVETIGRQKITTLHFVPSMLQLFLQEKGVQKCSSLKNVICSGEALPFSLQQSFYTKLSARLHNLYGPTEASIDVTSWACNANDKLTIVPIGRPIANTQLYLLDQHLQLAPLGSSAELFIGGHNLARAYLNRPELTAERFLPDPFSHTPGARLYRTGDRARYRSDGTVEYLGRYDEQVKLRGYRIELGEIEAVLGEHAGLTESVVLLREEQGEPRLVAYLVAGQEPAVSVPEVREYLRGRLPEYMVPASYVYVEQLPLSANGKVDRRALAEMEAEWTVERRRYVGPQTPIEEMLCRLYEEVLRVERVGVEDSFFEMGGHSLLATQLVSRVRETFEVEVPLRALFEAPTIAGLAQRVELSLKEASGLNAPPIERVLRSAPVPLSFAQQRLWFIDQLEGGSAFYNLSVAVRLSGQLNVSALEATLSEIIRRHEVLRTHFAVLDGEPVQIISAAAPLNLNLIDLSPLPPPQRQIEADLLTKAEAHRPFDLSSGPLIRISLLKLADDEHIVHLTMHHIVSDGWSMGVLVKEVAALYQAFSAGKPSPLPELSIQYADYASWQREYLQGEVLENQLSYWRRQLGGELPVLELPTDRPRPAVQSYRGAVYVTRLPQSLAREVKALSRQHGVTLYMTLLAVFQVLLLRYTGQDDILVGTAMANRTRKETEELIGFFINTLVMRTDLSGDPTFIELLKRVREVCLGAYAHQDVPFDKLVEELQPERSLNQMPVFQVAFGVQNAPLGQLEMEGLRLSPLAQSSESGRYDLTVWVSEAGEEVRVRWTYNTDMFEEERVVRMESHYEQLLESMMREPEGKLSSFQMMSEQERQEQLQHERESLELTYSKFINIKPKPVRG